MRLPDNLKQGRGTKTLDSQIGKMCQHSYKDPSKPNHFTTDKRDDTCQAVSYKQWPQKLVVDESTVSLSWKSWYKLIQFLLPYKV